MAQVVFSYDGKISHISDSVKDTAYTRCGRTLKHFGTGFLTELCSKCGTEADFEKVKSELNEAYRQKAEQQKRDREAAEIRAAERLETHRQLMNKFAHILGSEGAELTEVRESSAGGSIKFHIDGLRFTLRGDIWE